MLDMKVIWFEDSSQKPWDIIKRRNLRRNGVEGCFAHACSF